MSRRPGSRRGSPGVSFSWPRALCVAPPGLAVPASLAVPGGLAFLAGFAVPGALTVPVGPPAAIRRDQAVGAGVAGLDGPFVQLGQQRVGQLLAQLHTHLVEAVDVPND